jgi:hypothetical protein
MVHTSPVGRKSISTSAQDHLQTPAPITRSGRWAMTTVVRARFMQRANAALPARRMRCIAAQRISGSVMQSHLPAGDSRGIVFATTADGVTLPVIDVTHPAFAIPDSRRGAMRS